MNGNDQPTIGELLADRLSEFTGDTTTRRLWPPNTEETSRSDIDDLIRESTFILDGITSGEWNFDELPDKTVVSGSAGELIAVLPSVLIREQSSQDARFITRARSLLPKLIAELRKLEQPNTAGDSNIRKLESLDDETARNGAIWQAASGAQAQFRESIWWVRGSARSFWVNYLPIEWVGPGPYTELQS